MDDLSELPKNPVLFETTEYNRDYTRRAADTNEAPD